MVCSAFGFCKPKDLVGVCFCASQHWRFLRYGHNHNRSSISLGSVSRVPHRYILRVCVCFSLTLRQRNAPCAFAQKRAAAFVEAQSRSLYNTRTTTNITQKTLAYSVALVHLINARLNVDIYRERERAFCTRSAFYTSARKKKYL